MRPQIPKGLCRLASRRNGVDVTTHTLHYYDYCHIVYIVLHVQVTAEEDGSAHFDAFQVSKQCMEMVAEGALDVGE